MSAQPAAPRRPPHGTDSTEVSNGNVSWDAIFAGVVTFLAIMILLGVGAAAMGLQGSGGLATGIFALISLAVAFAAAGYVSGALGVRTGLLHGLGTWAASLILAGSAPPWSAVWVPCSATSPAPSLKPPVSQPT